MDTAVKMTGISMQFPGVLANDKVDFEVRKGEVHALVGENGAGKTTLMNILYGLYVPTEGQIEIWGKPVSFSSAVDAIRAGIGMVHQHFMLIPRLSVADNIVLGSEPRKRGRYLRKTAEEQVQTLCAEYDIQLDITSKVSQVSLGMQQRVEIAKTLFRKADILILDEPTAVLTPQEITELGTMLKKLKSMGKTVIIITHKLQEVVDFSDRVTVLRRGKVVDTVDTADTSTEMIAHMMVGRQVHLGGEKRENTRGSVVLQVKNLGHHNGRTQKLKDVSLEVYGGEILGIAGIDNSGQRELSEVIAGIFAPQTGEILLNGQEITGLSAAQIKSRGVGFISQDRQKTGLVLEMTVQENLALGYQDRAQYKKRRILLNKIELNGIAKQRIEEYDIRPQNPAAQARTLSGGNQQKIVVAREVKHASSLIIADQPSRGVDIGAIELIHQTLVQARNEGQAVLLISLELDEVMLLSDRIAVMYDGRLMGIVNGGEATREQLGLMMAGGGQRE